MIYSVPSPQALPPTSDIDFVVYGCDNLIQLEDDLLQIETLRKIDIFDFDSIKNKYLLEDIKKLWQRVFVSYEMKALFLFQKL